MGNASLVSQCNNWRAGESPLGRCCSLMIERARVLQRIIGNQATLRYLTQCCSSSFANGSSKGHASDPELIGGEPGTIPPARPELPESPAVRKAIHAATVENRTTAPPPPAAFSAALKRVSMRDDARADRSTRLLNAGAVAFGEQIMFRRSYYEPATERGRALIAHELTHVAHQNQIGRSFPQRFVAGDVLSVQFSRTSPKPWMMMNSSSR
jgi:hypothetical protein